MENKKKNIYVYKNTAIYNKIAVPYIEQSMQHIQQ